MRAVHVVLAAVANLLSFTLVSSDYCAGPQPMPAGSCFWPETGKPGFLSNSTLTTAAACCELCAKNDKCAFWAARPLHKKCFLMQSGMQHMTEADCQAGVKPPPPTPPTPAPVPTPPYPDNPRKNVLLLAVDDLRPQFSCLDAPGTVRPDGGMHTPRVCALAADSLVAMRSQVAMATCSPSRTAMLTGRHTSATHVWDLYSYFRNVTGNWTTLPQYFKDFHGYKTYGMGKIFHPGVASGGQGSATGGTPECPICRGPDDGAYSWSEPYFHGDNSGDPANLAWRAVPAAERAKTPLQDDMTLAHAKATLAAVAKDPLQPFFVAVGFHKPHLPFVFPEEFLEKYPNDSIQLPPNMYAPDGMPAIAWQAWGETRNYADIKPLGLSGAPNASDGGMPPSKTLELRRAYYSAVSYTDDNIGQVLDALEENGLSNSTIIALWGDHGWHLGEHGEWDKHTNFDLNTHAPVMFRVPGLTDGGIKTFTPTESVDIFPTLVDFALGEREYAALKVCPDDFDSSNVTTCREGMSLRPLVANPDTPIKTAAFSMYNRGIPKADGTWEKEDESPLGAEPKPSPCLIKDNGKDACAMGYTMLTSYEGHEVRYTEWVKFPGKKDGYKPDWQTQYGVELYNHTVDAAENRNAASSVDVTVLKALRAQLRAGWRAAQVPQL